jgi:hypothetical protein
MKIGGASIPEGKSNPSPSRLDLRVPSGHPASKIGVGKSGRFIVHGTVKSMSQDGDGHSVSLELTKHHMVGHSQSAGHTYCQTCGYRGSETFCPEDGTRMHQQDRTVKPNDGPTAGRY